MLPQVDPRLRGVPFDADRHHTSMYVRCMYCARWEWRGQRIALKLRATRPPAQEYWTNSPCPPGHNAPLPLRRSPPASFERLLAGSIAITTSRTVAPSTNPPLAGHGHAASAATPAPLRGTGA